MSIVKPLFNRFTLCHKPTTLFLKQDNYSEIWIADEQMNDLATPTTRRIVIRIFDPLPIEQIQSLKDCCLTHHIDHPYMIKLLDVGVEDNIFYQVAEFIDGFTIKQIIERSLSLKKTIPISVICHLLIDICDGLGYLHNLKDQQGQELGFVHSNVSPEYLLISPSGMPKIMYWGNSVNIRDLKKHDSKTTTAVNSTNLRYMSPEQLSSESIDQQTDIYSLGLVLYELLILAPCHQGANLMEVYYQVYNEEFSVHELLQKRPDCPTDLAHCLVTALKTDKKNRYNTILQMKQAIELCVHHQNMVSSTQHVIDFIHDLFLTKSSLTSHENNKDVFFPIEKTSPVVSNEEAAAATETVSHLMEINMAYEREKQKELEKIEEQKKKELEKTRRESREMKWFVLGIIAGAIVGKVVDILWNFLIKKF